MSVLKEFAALLRGRQPGRVEGLHNGRPLLAISYASPGECEVEGLRVEALWGSQPHLRTVVDFVARSVAPLGLHTFERNSEGDPSRARDSKLAELLDDPNPEQTGPELIFSLAHDIALYDDAFLFLAQADTGRWQARVIPPSWVTVEVSNRTTVTGYIVNGVRVPLQYIVRFPGHTPGDPTKSTSPVDTLRLQLSSEHQSQKYRRDLFKRGGRLGGVISRPAGAPTWEDAGRAQFDAMWSAFQEGGSRAGGTPILEDGMTYSTPQLTASSEQSLEFSRASLETVAQLYGIHPANVGVPGSSGWSSKELRKSLLSDSLAWLIKRIESRFTSKVMPVIGEDAGRYAEFNVEGRLRGDFTEQAASIRSSVGAPFLTIDEARALQNRPPLPDGAGAQVVKPLNLSYEGDSHRDAGDDIAQQDGVANAQKAADAVIARAGARMEQVARSAKGGGRTEWFDEARWLRETSDDFVRAGVIVQDERVASIVSTLFARADASLTEGAITT